MLALNGQPEKHHDAYKGIKHGTGTINTTARGYAAQAMLTSIILWFKSHTVVTLRAYKWSVDDPLDTHSRQARLGPGLK